MDVTGLPGTATGLLHRQKLDDQVTSLRARVEKLRRENDDLKAKRDKNEKDTHEFVAYFQKEMEKKDTIVATLSDEVRNDCIPPPSCSLASKPPSLMPPSPQPQPPIATSLQAAAPGPRAYYLRCMRILHPACSAWTHPLTPTH